MTILPGTAAAILILVLPETGFGKSVTIGAVTDGPFPQREKVQKLFAREMAAVSGSEHQVHFPDEKILVGDWNPGTIGKLFRQLLEDGEVDVVLAAGLVASELAIQQNELSKPVIAPFIMDRTLQNAPFQEGKSGVHNLTYLDIPHNIERDIRYFKELYPFKNLAFVVNSMLPRASIGFDNRLQRLAKEVACNILPVPALHSADSLLQQIPDNADAVYLYSLAHLPETEFARLVEGLRRRRLPSFSCMGARDVEKGIMVSLSPDPLNSISRRVAVNIQRILMGEDPADFTVYYSAGERLTFNMETARQIGFEPPWTIFNEADIVGEIRSAKGREVTMKTVALEAAENNLELAADVHGTASAKQDMKASWSALMPRLEAGGTGLAVEEETAAAAQGMQPQYSGSIYGKLTQVVFSERANANISVQKHLYAARKFQLEQLKLDITLDVTEAYLNVLRAGALEKIRRENMERNRTYLQLARMRVSVGSAGQSEVFRWESQIAASQKELIEANANRNLAEIAVNRLLSRPQEEPFSMKEQNYDYGKLLQDWEYYNRCFINKSSFQAFREFMVKEALTNSPELKSVGEAITIQERTLAAANRSLWIPTLSLQGQVENLFYRGGEGSDTPPGYPDDFTWRVGANLSLPIYQGNEAFALRKGHLEAMSQQRLEKKAVMDKIEQRMRSHMHQAGATYAGMAQARKAAGAAAEGLEIVKDAYARGVASISELTDARAQAQIAAEAESEAVFNYLRTLMQVQRAAGQFDFFRTAKEKSEFFNRLEAGVWSSGK